MEHNAVIGETNFRLALVSQKQTIWRSSQKSTLDIIKGWEGWLISEISKRRRDSMSHYT